MRLFKILCWLALLPLLEACAAPMRESGARAQLGAAAFLASAPTVVIDAGHGGTDHGARAKKPFCEEKRVALATARLVKKYLNQLGYHVVMTRSTDEFLPLERRVEIANHSSADLFVSIHFNSSHNSSARGTEIFFSDAQGKRSTLSQQAAQIVLSRLLRRTQSPSRGVKKGNFYVIRETRMPAILVEGGFISNPEERTHLKDPEYLDQTARGIVDGIDLYLRNRK